MACVAAAICSGLEPATSIGSSHSPVKRPSACRRQTMGTMTAFVLAASTAGPAGNVVQSPKRRTGTPSDR